MRQIPVQNVIWWESVVFAVRKARRQTLEGVRYRESRVARQESGGFGPRAQVMASGKGNVVSRVRERCREREERLQVAVARYTRNEHFHRRLSRPSIASSRVCVSALAGTRTGVPKAPLAWSSAACGSNL